MVNSWGDPELVGGLGRGDCAITFFPPQTFRVAQGQSEQPLLTAPIPKGSVKRISHLGGRALGINANTKHPKEAWEFVRYLVGPETFKTKCGRFFVLAGRDVSDRHLVRIVHRDSEVTSIMLRAALRRGQGLARL